MKRVSGDTCCVLLHDACYNLIISVGSAEVTFSVDSTV